MTALSQMHGHDVARWIVGPKPDRHGISRLGTLARIISVTDPELTDELAELVGSGNHALDEQLDVIAGRGAKIDASSLPLLLDVGAEVVMRDLDNLDLWQGVAAAVRDGSAPHRRENWPSTVINQMVRSGRSPIASRDLVVAANSMDIPVSSFGFDSTVTPNAIRELAAAGVRNAEQVAEWTELGVGFSEMIELAQNRVHPVFAAFAAREGLPRTEWARVLSQAPDDWAKSAYAEDENILTAGASWSDVAELAQGGWSDLPIRRVTGKNGTWGKEHGHSLTVAQGLRLARLGVSYEDFGRWGVAMCSGKLRAEARDRAMPPLLGGFVSAQVITDAIAELVDVGVRPTHIAEWRACGARSAGDIVAAISQGVDVKRAKALREGAAPAKRWASDTFHFGAISQLLAEHRRHPEAA